VCRYKCHLIRRYIYRQKKERERERERESEREREREREKIDRLKDNTVHRYTLEEYKICFSSLVGIRNAEYLNTIQRTQICWKEFKLLLKKKFCTTSFHNYSSRTLPRLLRLFSIVSSYLLSLIVSSRDRNSLITRN